MLDTIPAVPISVHHVLSIHDQDSLESQGVCFKDFMWAIVLYDAEPLAPRNTTLDIHSFLAELGIERITTPMNKVVQNFIANIGPHRWYDNIQWRGKTVSIAVITKPSGCVPSSPNRSQGPAQ